MFKKMKGNLVHCCFHHQVELAEAFMSLSLRPSRSCNKAGRSFGRHPASLQSSMLASPADILRRASRVPSPRLRMSAGEARSMQVIAGRPTRLLPWLGDQSSRLLASSCFARQQWPAKRTLRSRKIVEMSGMGSWNCSLVGCCLREMLSIARSASGYRFHRALIERFS